MGPEGSQVTIVVCTCKRTGCMAGTHALGFLVGWLRRRSDNERALLALLRAAAVGLEGAEVV